MNKNMFGTTKLGIVSTIISIVGAVLVGVGSVGSTLSNNAVVINTAQETAKEILSE